MDRLFWSEMLKMDDEGVPQTSTIQILRTGSFHHRQHGNFVVDDAIMSQIQGNFQVDRVPLDYNHGSTGTNPDATLAAGWVKNLTTQQIDGDDAHTALMAEVEFTDRARQHVAANEFRYISPEFTFSWTNPQTGAASGAKLLAVALTNRPFLPGMLPVTLSDDGWMYDDNKALEAEIDDKVMALGESLSDLVEDVTRSFYSTYRDSEAVTYWIKDVQTDRIIAERRMNNRREFFEIGFASTNDGITFAAPDSWVQVRQTYEPIRQGAGMPSASLTDKQEDNLMLEQLRTLLGLSEGATEADVEGAIKALTEKAGKVEDLIAEIATLTEKVSELELADKDDSEAMKLQEEKDALESEKSDLTVKLDGVQTENVALSGRLQTLEDERKADKAQDRIDKALQDRRLTPAEAEDADDAKSEWYKLALESPERFDKLISTKPQYEKAILETVGEDANEGGEEPKTDTAKAEKYWVLVEEYGDRPEYVGIPLQDVRAAVKKDHPAVAKAAGL